MGADRGHSILGLNPPQRHRTGARRRVRDGMLVGLGGLIVIVTIGTGLTGGKFGSSASGSQIAAHAAGSAAARSKPGAAGPGPGPLLTYRVTGTRGARVTYGPAGSSFTGRVPMRVTTALGSSLYYSITAQLPGSGSVTCELLIGSKVMSKSVATSGYHYAACQISQNPLTGKWQDAGSG